MTRPPAPPIPLEADERTMLNSFLDFYRSALLDRAYGLDRDQLNTTLPPSSLTIARLLSHMAWVEQVWYRVRFDGEEFAPPFDNLDFEADSDAEMTIAETWSVEELVAVYNDAIVDSSVRVAATPSLDDVSPISSDGRKWSMRWIMVHMIEEYARHCGHADLIRESIDGDTCS